MELWLDTIDYQLITNAIKRINITGITTNPSILSKSDDSPEKTIKKLLDIQPGLLAVQVTSNDEEIMVKQARKIRKLSDRIIIKVPVCQSGLSVIKTLSDEKVPVMATAIFEPIQIYLSILSGASYAAPYLGRIEKITGDFTKVIGEMMSVIKNSNSNLKLLTASISTRKQIMDCALLCVHAITLPEKAYAELMLDHPQTIQCLESFVKSQSCFCPRLL